MRAQQQRISAGDDERSAARVMFYPDGILYLHRGSRAESFYCGHTDIFHFRMVKHTNRRKAIAEISVCRSCAEYFCNHNPSMSDSHVYRLHLSSAIRPHLHFPRMIFLPGALPHVSPAGSVGEKSPRRRPQTAKHSGRNPSARGEFKKAPVGLF